MIPAALRREVSRRADDRCEYCKLSQAGQEAAFHIDHVIPISQEGQTVLSNLALACVSCSLRKGAQTSALDPQSKSRAPIFNPRSQIWSEHFRWNNLEVIPTTAIGRATVALLQFNRPIAVAIRAEEKLLQRHPPL